MTIGEGAVIGAPLDEDSELTVIGPNVEIPAGTKVAPGKIIATAEDLTDEKGGR